MIRLFWVALLCLGAFARADEYYILSEFDAQNPRQPALAEALKQRVNAPARPLNGLKPVRIAVVHPALQGSDFWDRAVTALSARLSDYNVTHTLELYTSRRHEVRKQIAQVQQALEKEPDYLLFHLDSVRHEAAVEQLLEREKPKLILQNITTPAKGWSKQPFFYSGFDHERGSVRLADRLIELTGGKGQYAVIYGLQGHVATMRGGSFIRRVEADSKLQMVASYYTEADSESARRAATEILEAHPNIRFIYACTTDVALGVAEAIAQKRLTGKVLVNGWGGGSAELEALQKGRLDLTIMRMNDDHGVAMAEAIVMDLTGQADKLPQVFSGDLVVVEKEAGADRLEKLRNHAFRYSGR